MSHTAFCTVRALQADLRMLGYKHTEDVACVAPGGDERLATLRFLAEEISGSAFVEPDDALTAFYDCAGLPSAAMCAPKRRAAAAAFMRAAIDLAAASRARRAVAHELEFDSDEYGVFTAEDEAADMELTALIERRAEIFPRTTTTSATGVGPAAAAPQAKRRRPPTLTSAPTPPRKPLAHRDANVAHARKKAVRKPPLPAAAMARTTSAPSMTTTTLTPTVAEILRDARERAHVAVKEAVRSGVSMSNLSVDVEADAPQNEVPAILDADVFFAEDSLKSRVIRGKMNEDAEFDDEDDDQFSEDPASSDDADASIRDVESTEGVSVGLVKPSTGMTTGSRSVDARKTAALQHEIDALATDAANALKAVHDFQSMAEPLLKASDAARIEDTLEYDLEMDAELSESILVAYGAQKRMLADLRAHVDINRSYSALERWAQVAPPENVAAKYCRQRAESAMAFTNAIQAD